MSNCKKYIYVTGGKGGIGKSAMALQLADYYSHTGNVLLIDTDSTNPDSSAAFKKGTDAKVTAIKGRVRSEDSSGQIDSSGLLETLNAAETSDAETIIVDAPGGDSVLLATAGSIISEACKQMNMDAIFVWLVDSIDRTPVNTVHTAWDSIKNAEKILLVKNYRKGTNFNYFDSSQVMEVIKAAPNVQIIGMPKLASRLEEHVRIDRMNWQQIATETPIANRIEGQRVRSEFHKTFREAGL
jgi:Mrp family chromosome partitioning ATPase